MSAPTAMEIAETTVRDREGYGLPVHPNWRARVAAIPPVNFDNIDSFIGALVVAIEPISDQTACRYG